MPAPDALADLALLEDAARAAGAIAMQYWKAAPRAWEKPDGAGPVSEADLAVDRHLRDHLRRARPDYGWLSEESADDPARLEARRCFIVDPIDGTRAFLAGKPDFAVALAVVERGEPLAGVVLLPARGWAYAATRGGVARMNERPIRCASTAGVDGATVLANAASLDVGRWPGGAPQVARVFRPSLAWRLCLVAEGAFDAALSLGDTWEWDIAAGALVAQAAGVTVTDRAGVPLRFNRARPRMPGLLAAPGPLHRALLARLTPSPRGPDPGDTA